MKNLANKLVKKLIQKKLKISFAESCTGGMLSSTITSVSGSSKVFNLGLVTYSNKAKIDTNDFINIIADLTIGKGPFKDTYKSDVKFNKKNNSIYVTNIDGPLKHLDNKWTFEDHKEGTEIYFDVDFEIENKFLNILMTTSFQYGLDKIADAFQDRANKLFKN